jgi:hypothetical protein
VPKLLPFAIRNMAAKSNGHDDLNIFEANEYCPKNT